MKNGDIDNRIKTLIDGLRLPQSKEEMVGIEEYFDDSETIFCLLEDDDKIAHFSVETDTLLKPESGDISQSHADIMLTVEIKPIIVTIGSVSFLS